MIEAVLLFLMSVGAYASQPTHESMVLVPSGSFTPFFLNQKSKSPIPIDAFWIDIYPATNADYLEFVQRQTSWRKSKVKPVFADSRYLQRWTSDLKFPRHMSRTPVTFISWFAAKAYCESKGKRLPSTAQWEYAAYDDGHFLKKNRERVLKWYSKPNTKNLPSVGLGPKNMFGIYDLLGLIWEWTDDFNSVEGSDANAFCGGGAAAAKDSTDYASFMRYAFRSSLKAPYTTANLGFRCAKEVLDEH